jgi:Carboxypeptidase regulatory-like domain
MSAQSSRFKATTVFFAFSTMFCVPLIKAQNPPSAPPEMATSPQAFKIAGTVVNAITGAPLSRVHISIADTRARMQGIEIVTGEDGHFEFSPLPPSKYALQGRKGGYITAGYDQHEQYATAIVTGPEFITDKLVFRLMPMAVISGHVLDESGEPVRNAQIGLFGEDHSGGMNRVRRMNGVTADDRGYFEFSLLPPGTYFVSANSKPWYAVYPNARPGSEATQKIPPELNVAYPTTYYGGATDSEGAAPITLKGGDRREIDIRLVPVPALRLVLHVPVEQPTEGEQLQPRGYAADLLLKKHAFDSSEFIHPQTQMVEPGVFEIIGVPAGRYDVAVNNPGVQGRQQFGEMNLTRDGQDLGSTESQPSATLKVQLKMAEDEPLPKQYFLLLTDSHQKGGAGAQGDASGEVTLEGVRPGKYGIVVFPMGRGKSYSVIHLSSGKTALPGREVELQPDATSEVTAELATGEMRIDGVVQKNGKPLAGIMVALVPNDPEANVDLFRRDQSDFDGTFTLQSVIPGSYTVVAVEDAWGFEWLKAGVLARYVQHGQQVIIGEKMRGTLHLPDPVEVQSK